MVAELSGVGVPLGEKGMLSKEDKTAECTYYLICLKQYS